MSYDYDALYSEQPDALGPPTLAFVDFFATFAGSSVDVLDIGCGQGRDSLFIARLGHSVTAVDLSPACIADVIRIATQDGLPIRGVVADITTWRPDTQYDVLLIDRTLHMLDDAERDDVFADLLVALRVGGDLLLADEPSNMAGFRAVMAASGRDWQESPRLPNGLLFAKG